MTLAAVRVGLVKSVGIIQVLSTTAKQLCKPNLTCMFRNQSAGIVSKQFRDLERDKAKHFPYREKRFNAWVEWFDNTMSKMDENSKIIIVEGPIAAGKSELAVALADELGMFHIPEANMDMYYINSYGYDLRQLDPQLPESVQSFDEKKFLENPTHFNAAFFQISKYQLKFEQYLLALEHLFSTGQGVVMERSCYSDFVFMENMVKFGYMTKQAKVAYEDICEITIRELIRPHLVLYLDVPVKEVQRRIVERNIPYEVNSKALTTEYLENMEILYKQKYLKDISQHAELLVYDWSEKGDVEVIVEDIEQIDFDNYEQQDPKLSDWRVNLVDKKDWAEARYKYTRGKENLLLLYNIPYLDAPELIIETEDMKKYNAVKATAPGEKYARGFNKDQGDTGILWKIRDPY